MFSAKTFLGVNQATYTIVFTVASGGLTSDPATGNMIPATTTLSVECTLHKSAIQSTPAPGIDQNAISIDGHCVSPTKFPHAVRVQTQAIGRVTFDGRPGTIRVNVAQNELGTKFFGERFNGTFIPD